MQNSVLPEVKAIWANVQTVGAIVNGSDAGLALVRQGGWAFVGENIMMKPTLDASNGQLVIRHSIQTQYYAFAVQKG